MLHKWFIGSFLDLFLSSDVSHNDNVKLTELFVKSQLFQIPMTAEALRQVVLDKGSLRLSLTGETPLLNKCACEVVVKHSIGRKRYVIP